MLAAAQVIRAIAGRIAGLPLAGDRVYTSRAWPLSERDLPAWRVVAHDEDIEPLTIHRGAGASQQHTLQVELHGFVRAVDDIDAAYDALALEAQLALFALTPPADALAALRSTGKLKELSQRRTERAPGKEGEAALGLVLITLRAVFCTRPHAPETLI